MDQVLGEQLLGGGIEDGTRHDVKQLLQSTKTIGLYFSASWCGPCKSFTPLLKAVYEAKKEADEGFEIIFCSRDKTQKEFDEYFGMMPWKAIPFADAKRLGDAIQTKLKVKVERIPTLLLVDPKLGILIEKDGRGRILDYQRELAVRGDSRQITAHPAVAKLSQGLPITVFFLNEVNGVDQRTCSLRFELTNKPKKQGTLRWAAVDRKKDGSQADISGSMNLCDIDGISLGKAGLILKAPGGGGVTSSQCFSISCGSSTLAAAIVGSESSRTVLDAIQHILSCSKDRLSRDKKVASNGSVKDPVIGFRVVRWTPELEEMERKRKELARGPPKVDPKDLMDCKEVKQLKKGMNIMVYSLDEMNIAKASKMCLLYDPKIGRLGTFIWCDRRKKRKPPKSAGRLEIDTLACISLKKQTRILQTAAATMAEAEACISLIGPESQVSIEMEDGELDVEVVVAALQHILSVSKDKKLLKKTEGHGKFEKVSHEVFKLEEILAAKMKGEDEEGEATNGQQVNVDLNWTTPLGFDGGVVAGGG
eukprot:CAMPEP_0114522766 /NCGR_PEP_ID=MMETSP0109-20121206/20921_1 /TAXON_ID=29199 /ORGANISM="Chlorarachnion reptans, Strain CCCM449" /LENGTH=534 /DNA_ID=CAMNT_0001704013 /DNA_START=95 /DNA_END=1702 /DNA_ORIENTATION=+